MDVETRVELKEIILGLKNDRCIVLSTHHVEDAETMADSVGFLYKGRLTSFGSVDFLRDKFGFG
jgi:ATP-binding cassette subfamily A (ABC1) protein 3